MCPRRLVLSMVLASAVMATAACNDITGPEKTIRNNTTWPGTFQGIWLFTSQGSACSEDTAYELGDFEQIVCAGKSMSILDFSPMDSTTTCSIMTTSTKVMASCVYSYTSTKEDGTYGCRIYVTKRLKLTRDGDTMTGVVRYEETGGFDCKAPYEFCMEITLAGTRVSDGSAACDSVAQSANSGLQMMPAYQDRWSVGLGREVLKHAVSVE